MAITPLDSGRYGSGEMRQLFEESFRYQLFLDVESMLAQVQAELGMIPPEAAQAISQRADIRRISPERIRDLEQTVRHELVAVLRAFAEICGEHGRYVHYGATSSDILDTAMALQLKKAIGILDRKTRLLLKVLLECASRHRSTLMVGRTHGQHALPITFGFKVAVWADELARNRMRLQQLQERLLVGKLSGAVGSMASFGEKGGLVQRQVLARLGLGEPAITNQAVSRDRLAEFILWGALLAALMETIATEVRNLQRPEIGEVSEPFDRSGQVGSSTMPHKRNPVLSENVCGLARLVRSFVVPALENVALWHERDLTHSANERFILPEACILLDEMLEKMIHIVSGLEVRPERMKANLELSRKGNLAESALLALVRKGMDRAEAYRLVQSWAFRSESEGVPVDQSLREHPDLREMLENGELPELLEEGLYVGLCSEMTSRVVQACARDLDSDSEPGEG
jgi:adenylosuccinate lyase